MGCTTHRVAPTNEPQSEQQLAKNKTVSMPIHNGYNPTIVHEHDISEVDKGPGRYNITPKHRQSVASLKLVDSLVCPPPIINMTLIWLNTQSPSEPAWLSMQEAIKNIFSELQIHHDVVASIYRMSRMTTHYIFIIICGPLAVNEMITIDNMPQVQAIYLCSNHMQDDQSRFSKLKSAYNDADTLAHAINSDTASFQTDSITIFQTEKTETSTRELSEENAWFISFHYLLEILFHLPLSDDVQAKVDIVNVCRKFYAGNEIEQKCIDEFEQEYVAEKALWWYTRESFLYRALNKSLRSNDTMQILTFRLIIKHIHQEILELNSQSQSQLKNDIIVYRGQLMNINEVKRLTRKDNSLISINTFLSTSRDRETALQFLQHQVQNDHQLVLFTIRLTSSAGGQPFAYIGHRSYFQGENEVLISPGSVFIIDDTTMMENNSLDIRMTLREEHDVDIKAAIGYLTAQIGDSSSLLTFGGFLLDRGEFKNVKEFCKMMNAALPPNDAELVTVYNNWGGAFYYEGDYRTALDYYKVAYEISELHLETISTDSIATTESRIGAIYYKMNDPSTAINYFKHALTILESDETDCAHIVRLYSQTALAYAEFGDNPKAVEFINKAICMAEEKCIPKKHSTYAWFKMSQAIVPSKTLNTEQRSALFAVALQSFHDSLPKNHPDLITIQLAMGDFHQSNGQYKLASENFNEALNMCKKSLLPDHPDARICQRRIKLLPISK